MNRRYNLQRSDNYPETGTYSASVSGSGSFTVTTGFPVTSAHVSHISGYSGIPGTNLVLDSGTQEFALDGLYKTLSPTEPVIIQQVEFWFSRHSTPRQYSIKSMIGGQEQVWVENTNTTTNNVIANEQAVL